MPFCADGVDVSREAIVDRMPALVNTLGAASGLAQPAAAAAEPISMRCTQSLPGSSANLRAAPDALSLLSSPAASSLSTGDELASPTAGASERSASLARLASRGGCGCESQTEREQKTIRTVPTPVPDPPDEITVVVEEYSDDADGDVASGSTESLATDGQNATGLTRCSSSPLPHVERVQVMQFRLKSRVKHGLKCARSSSLTRSANGGRRLGRFWATVGLSRSRRSSAQRNTSSDSDADSISASDADVDVDAELNTAGECTQVKVRTQRYKKVTKTKKAAEELTPIVI